MQPTDADAFGRALAKLRLTRGFTQKEVADRIPTYYGDAGAYGRVERSERHPDRDTLIAILARGLLISDAAEINRVLQLADYQALNAEEQLGLARSSTVGPQTSEAAQETLKRIGVWTRLKRNSQRLSLSAGILAGSLILASLIVVLLVSRQAVFALVTSCFYAALYVVSLYLESAFQPERLRSMETATICFGFVAVTSAAALATDRILVDSGNSFALLFSLVIFSLAAMIQFFIVRSALPENAIVQASFQTRTAQSAHLKNTGYFLLIVMLFWLPSFHCVSTLTREVRAGHADWVRQVLQRDLMLGRGLLALSVRWLLLLLLIMFLISLYMAHRLLDNLRSHPQLNSYTMLFYLRAFLYFLLCLISIGWYAYSLSEFVA